MATLVWEPTTSGLSPVYVDGPVRREVAWAPQPGSQTAFLTCPVTEVLFEGTRGNGKTDAILMDYAQFVGQGYKNEWRGILFRRTYKELEDLINKSLKWIPRIFPTAQYNSSSHTWKFHNGETLLFRYFENERDYWGYHGHAFPWIGWEELCLWPDDRCYRSMFSCARSPHPNIPIRIRATANPYGPGHNWVKNRFKLPGHSMRVIYGEQNADGTKQPDRVSIRGDLRENKVLLHADPNYMNRLTEAARNQSELRAWTKGDWNIVAGGMFDDVYDADIHIVPTPSADLIPASWLINRSYDHGQSKPFSVGWWAESSGEPFEYMGHMYGACRGDVYRIREWYGCHKTRINEGLNLIATRIAEGILEREIGWRLEGRVKAGPADTQIYTTDASGGKSVAKDMAAVGVNWVRANKGPGSRILGWQQVRAYLENAKNPQRERPGLFICDSCTEWQRTVPVLSRDDANIDDVDSESEDHIGDEMRYRLFKEERVIRIGLPTLVEAT